MWVAAAIAVTELESNKGEYIKCQIKKPTNNKKHTIILKIVLIAVAAM